MFSTRVITSAVPGRQEADQRQTVKLSPPSQFSAVWPLRTKPSTLRSEHKAGAGGPGTRTLSARSLQVLGSLPNFPKGCVRTTQRTIVSRGQRKVGQFSLFNNIMTQSDLPGKTEQSRLLRSMGKRSLP